MGWVGDLDQLGWYIVQTLLDLSLINRVMNLIEFFFFFHGDREKKKDRSKSACNTRAPALLNLPQGGSLLSSEIEDLTINGS